MQSFSTVKFEHVPRAQNKHVVHYPHWLIKWTFLTDLFPNSLANQPFTAIVPKNFVATNDELYHRSGVVLARYMSLPKAKEELHQVHELPFGNSDVNLSQRLQRQGSY